MQWLIDLSTISYSSTCGPAHSVLIIIYHVLQTKQSYAELEADYFDKLNMLRIQQHHIRRLEQLGFSVTLTPKEAA